MRDLRPVLHQERHDAASALEPKREGRAHLRVLQDVGAEHQEEIRRGLEESAHIRRAVILQHLCESAAHLPARSESENPYHEQLPSELPAISKTSAKRDHDASCTPLLAQRMH